MLLIIYNHLNMYLIQQFVPLSLSDFIFFLFVSVANDKTENQWSQAVAIMLFSQLFYLDHWDYHPHPHVHPAEFENLQETNFTELQSVQALHPTGLIRHDAIRYEAENLLDPNLGAHPHVLQQPVSVFVTQQYTHHTHTQPFSI